MAEEKQDGQKTLVAFVVGLLIGGMLVWAFSGPTTNAPTENVADATASKAAAEGEESKESEATVASGEEVIEVSQPELQVGEGEVEVNDQVASASVTLESATYPVSEGWIGVREYNNDQLGYILGVVRFSESQGLVPAEIALQRATSPGNRYAVVIFTEDGDFEFSLAGDVQIDSIFDTFVAQ
jgi:hypothetical protein